MPEFRQTFPVEPASAGKARHAVIDFAQSRGAINGTVAAIALAVSEAVSNAIVHAYRHREDPGDIVVEAQHTPGGIRVLVIDDGIGIVPRTDSPGLGLGLAMIGRVADAVEVRGRPEGGTEVCMRFALDGA
jgi:anti-sigma regulatory factor (Ser/Thr protein kinase)